MWTTLQKRTVLTSDLLHATSEQEFAEIRARGLRMPVAVIPNGVDIPSLSTLALDRTARPRRLLYLGRLHPVKGIDNLLRAWAQVQGQYPEWELQIVGPDSRGYLRRLKALAQSLGACRVTFLPGVSGHTKSETYAAADLYVLPSSTENFGVTVAEALAHGVPTIVTDRAPWGNVERFGCGWSIPFGPAPLSRALHRALASSPAELARMGFKGREWMKTSFSWTTIGKQMAAAYEWLVGGGDTPSTVRRC